MLKTGVAVTVWMRLFWIYSSLPLLLLWCGGDLHWWQAWVYSLLLTFAGVGGHLWAEARHAGLMEARQAPENFKKAKRWDKLLAPLMAISISYPLVLVAGLDHRFSWSVAQIPMLESFTVFVSHPWINAIGLVFVALGYGVATWALAENRFFLSIVRIQYERGITFAIPVLIGGSGILVTPAI